MLTTCLFLHLFIRLSRFLSLHVKTEIGKDMSGNKTFFIFKNRQIKYDQTETNEKTIKQFSHVHVHNKLLIKLWNKNLISTIFCACRIMVSISVFQTDNASSILVTHLKNNFLLFCNSNNNLFSKFIFVQVILLWTDVILATVKVFWFSKKFSNVFFAKFIAFFAFI